MSQTPSPLSDESLTILRLNVNPLQSSSEYSLDLYIDTIKSVFDLLENLGVNT